MPLVWNTPIYQHFTNARSSPYHDDYEYKEVNVFLNRSIKAFVKKTVCYPELIDHSDFVHFSPLLLSSEKVHIGLLILEARKQAEIVYGIRSLEMATRKK